MGPYSVRNLNDNKRVWLHVCYHVVVYKKTSNAYSKQWTAWSEVHIRAYDAPDDSHPVTETYVGQS
jgi:hypothetical protein